jgi:pyruvate, water dikinase
LGELNKLKIVTPPSFIVSKKTILKFFQESNLTQEIENKLKEFSTKSEKEQQEITREIQQKIVSTSIPKAIQEEILEAYEALSIDPTVQGARIQNLVKQIEPYVSIEPSVIEQETEVHLASYQNIKGEKQVLAAILACWASLFTPRAIYHKDKNNFAIQDLSIIVQKTIEPLISGSITTFNNNILIQTCLGSIQTAAKYPNQLDKYILSKELELKSKDIKRKTHKINKDNQGKTIETRIEKKEQEIPSLSNHELKRLAKIATVVQENYNKAQQIDFIIAKSGIYVTKAQSTKKVIETVPEQKEEPIKEKVTIQKTSVKVPAQAEAPIQTSKKINIKEATLLVSGIAHSPGTVQGNVITINSVEDTKKIKQGDIVVARTIKDDYFNSLLKASAVITDSEEPNKKFLKIARKKRIPYITDTDIATHKLQTGQTITIDGKKGKIYEGMVNIKMEKRRPQLRTTKTQVLATLDLPEFAQRAAASGADGIGMLWGGGLTFSLGESPIFLIKSGRRNELIGNISKNLKNVCKTFKDKPVWYKTIDNTTDELRNILGGENEPIEKNPSMGWKSIRKSLDQPELLKAEFEAIKKTYLAGNKSIGVIIPFITHLEQLQETKKLFEKTTGLSPVKEVPFGISIETPAAVLLIEDICKEGISFATIDIENLTQYTLACDKNSHSVRKLFNTSHPAILRQIHKVLATCKKYHVQTSAFGHFGSDKITDFLHQHGVDSFATDTKAISAIRKRIGKLEGH